MKDINITNNPDTDSRLVFGMQLLATKFTAKKTMNDDGTFRYELVCDSITPLDSLYVDHIAYGAPYLYRANGDTMKIGLASENPRMPRTL